MVQRNGFEIASAALGVYQTNCYTLRSGDALWIIDAGFDPDPLIELVTKTGCSPEALILTHAHPDHIAGIPHVQRAFPGVPIWIHEQERLWLGDPELNLSLHMGQPISLPDADRLLKHGDRLTLGETAWTVRHTPGHSPGSISLICEDLGVAVVGDALFRESVGRTDFPGCSMETLSESIRSQFYSLPDETTVYPGHGPETTIGHEKRHNPFVRA